MEKGIYQHRYAIYDSNKVQLLYSITCKVSIDTAMPPPENIMCEICDEQLAVLYCLNDKTYFCKNCDENVHEQSYVNKTDDYLSKHKRVHISDAPKDFGVCSNT